MAMKAIETRYAGCRFRSRLEARWAILLDHLEIGWKYEPEGFETPAGWYLPDFYLPQAGAWLEIKGGSFTARDRMRAEHVADRKWAERGDKFRVLQGDIPRPGMRPVLPFPAQMGGSREFPGLLCSSRVTHPDFAMSHAKDRQDGRGPTVDWHCIREAPRIWVRMPWLPGCTEAVLDAALGAARSARFEHGEQG